jgi:hypothetical protein
MSSFWSTIIGAAAAIIGGLGAVVWQTRRADDIAQRIRRQERREQALFALSAKVQEVYSRLASIRPMAGTSPLTAQYFAASQALRELLQLWQTTWAAVIGDRPIRDACLVLTTRTADLLPGGDQAMLYPESEPAAKAAHFARDLQELLGLTDALGNEVIRATAPLLSSE